MYNILNKKTLKKRKQRFFYIYGNKETIEQY